MDGNNNFRYSNERNLIEGRVFLDLGNCFTVSFSKSPRVKERLRLVTQAVIEAARTLNAEIKFKRMERTLSIVVYYSMRDIGTFSVYCDWGKNWNVDEIYLSIISVISAFTINSQIVTPAQ